MSKGRGADGADGTDGKKRTRESGGLSENFFGTATVGERGQIVIPAEARKRFEIETGDKLLIVGREDRGLMLFKVDALRAMMDALMEGLRRAETADDPGEGAHDGHDGQDGG